MGGWKKQRAAPVLLGGGAECLSQRGPALLLATYVSVISAPISFTLLPFHSFTIVYIYHALFENSTTTYKLHFTSKQLNFLLF